MGNQEKDHNVIVQLFSPLPFEGGIPKEFMVIIFKISDLQIISKKSYLHISKYYLFLVNNIGIGASYIPPRND